MSSVVISRRHAGSKPISIGKRMRKASLGLPFEGNTGFPMNNLSVISPIKFGRKNSLDEKGGEKIDKQNKNLDFDENEDDMDDEEQKDADKYNDDLINTERKTAKKKRGDFDLNDHMAPMSTSRNALLGSRQKYRDDFN